MTYLEEERRTTVEGEDIDKDIDDLTYMTDDELDGIEHCLSKKVDKCGTLRKVGNKVITLRCKKMICSTCGGKKGIIHKNRYRAIMKRIRDFKIKFIRQLVFTVPMELRRKYFMSKEGLNRLLNIVKRIIKKYFGVVVCKKITKKGIKIIYRLRKEVFATVHLFGDQRDLTNDFYPDLVPPYIDDQYPAAAPPWVPNPPSTNVQVDIHDADEGVNLSTVRVYIEGALAYRGDTDSFLAPYNGPSSARITQPLGYRITIDPTSPFTSYQVVDVRVYAEDLAVIPNILDTLYQFRIADTSVPHLDNVVPAEGDTDVARNTNITLEILDSDSDVDEASVVITVAGVVAWQSQTAQPGFVVTATHLPTGWRYVINPDTDFASWQTVTVEV